MHLAKVGLQVDRVHPNRHRFDVPGGQLQQRRFIRAEHPFGGHAHRLGGKPSGGQLGLIGMLAPSYLAVFFQRLFQLAQLLLQRRSDHELRLGGRVGLGILGHQPPPIGDRLVPLLLLMVHLAKQIEDLRIAPVQRVLDHELRPELSGRIVLLVLILVLGHQVFGTDNLPLHTAPGLVSRMQREILPPG